MRKTLTLLAIISLCIGFSAAVANYNGSQENTNTKGEMHIMGASSASATSAAGPNGTQYYAEISETNTSGTITNESVSLVNRTENSINFTGKIQAPTPCHTLTHDVTRDNGSISLNISLESSDSICVQQVVMKEYDGYVKAEGLENVTVSHEGEQMGLFETAKSEQTGEPEEDTEEKVFFNGVLGWFSGFF